MKIWGTVIAGIVLLSSMGDSIGDKSMAAQYAQWIEESKVYLSPSNEAESTEEDQRNALEFRFQFNLTSNCIIEKFELEPDSLMESRTLNASILIPQNELDIVLSPQIYKPELRKKDMQGLLTGEMNEWNLSKQDVSYYHTWFDDNGGSSRVHYVVVFKAKDGFVRVYCRADYHTILNSLQDLYEW